jgi:large subunit ribosomal protein L11
MAKETIQALVDGGRASAGPPLGPKLGPLGVNVGQLIADINKATKDFEGIKVPVEIEIDTEKKTWEIKVGSPPTSQLLFKELKLQKGSGSAWRENKDKPSVVGDAPKEVIIKIAKIKKDAMGTKTLKGAVKNVLGTCLSVGITVEGKNPKEVQREIDEGKWDDLLK